MKKHRKIFEQLESLDFNLLPSQNSIASTGVCFSYGANLNAAVEKYLTVRYISRVDGYELMFALNCPTLRRYFNNSKLMTNEVSEAIAHMSRERPNFWYRLPIRFGSRMNSWSCPAQANEMERYFSNEIANFISCEIISIDSIDLLLQVYLKDEAPFEWRFGTSYFARMCEVAYLVAHTGSSHAAAQNLANQYYPFMVKSDLYGSKLPRDFYSGLVKSIEMELSLA